MHLHRSCGTRMGGLRTRECRARSTRNDELSYRPVGLRRSPRRYMSTAAFGVDTLDPMEHQVPSGPRRGRNVARLPGSGGPHAHCMPSVPPQAVARRNVPPRRRHAPPASSPLPLARAATPTSLVPYPHIQARDGRARRRGEQGVSWPACMRKPEYENALRTYRSSPRPAPRVVASCDTLGDPGRRWDTRHGRRATGTDAHVKGFAYLSLIARGGTCRC